MVGDQIKCSYKELVPLHKIIPNPKNTNEHPDKQIDLLAKIIDYQGVRHPIIVSNRSGFIAAGHGRLMAAQKLGMKEFPVDYQDFENEAEEYAFLESDNHLAELSEHNQEKMIANIKDMPDLDLEMLGIPDFEIPEVEDLEPGCDEDAVPELKEDPITKRGDIWLLGDHKVCCGDSTMIDDVEKLMSGEKADMVFTDPPYGMDYQLNTTKNKIDKIIGDSKNFDFLSLWELIFNIPVKYICTRFDKYVDWQNQVNDRVKNVIVWKKSNMGAGDLKNYGFQHEFIMYWGSKIDGSRDTNVWEEGNTPKSEYVNHPTQKPISLIERALKNHKLKICLDLFLGSGSTLIACEKTNRKCYGMELDEHYCDVIVNRWQKYTGKKAVLESNNKTYEELKNG